MKPLSTIGKILILAALTLGSTSCGFYKSKTSTANNIDLGKLVNDPHAQISYAQVKQAIIQDSCLSCHAGSQAAGGVALDSYEHVAQMISIIKADIDSGRMPLNRSPLSANQKALFDKWVLQGNPEAPANSGNSTPGDPTATPTPIDSQTMVLIRSNFDLFVKPLVKKACMDCHDSNAKLDRIGRLPIVRGVERKHIRAASHVLDFSGTFPNWSSLSSEPVYYLTQIRGAIINKTMSPKYYKAFHLFDGKVLRAADNQIILNWIDQSMKLLANIDTTPPSAQKYFATNCLGCHNSAIASGGFSFEKNGDELTIPNGYASNGMPFFTPSQPENSAIYVVLREDAERHGLRQMPLGGTASVPEQQLIFDWITSKTRH